MKPSTLKLITILAALAGSTVVVICSPAPAHAATAGQPGATGATAEEIRELRKQKEDLCLKNPEW